MLQEPSLDYLVKLGINSEKIKKYYSSEYRKDIQSLIHRLVFLNNQINGLSNKEYSIYGSRLSMILNGLIKRINLSLS